MSKQPSPAPTVSAVSPCPTIIQVSRTPRHWKFTQHHRTTRPPPSPEQLKKRLKKRKEGNADLMICPSIICFLSRNIFWRFTHYATVDSRRIAFIYKKLYRAVWWRITTDVFGCITEKNGRLFCCIATYFRGCNGIGDLLTRQARNFIYKCNGFVVVVSILQTNNL